jgi:hypothetical protein
MTAKLLTSNAQLKPGGCLGSLELGISRGQLHAQKMPLVGPIKNGRSVHL